MRSISIALCIVAMLASVAGAETATEGSQVFHVPIADAPSGVALEIDATIEDGWDDELAIRYRPLGEQQWREAGFAKVAGERHVASVPGDAVRPPGFEYFIVGAGGGPHFASADAPHRVYVFEDARIATRERELERAGFRRAQVRFAAELVDFGTRTLTDSRTGTEHRVEDRYYRLDADFSYRVFKFPLRALRFGFTQLVGTTPVTERGDGACDTRTENPCVDEAGFRAGGWAELRWRLSDLVNLDTRGLIQATPSGFGLGGRGELRFGDDMGSHFAIGGEAISEVGSSAFFRLGWDTVPRFPMAATIELSDYPSSHRDPAVRLLYDVAYDTGFGLRVGARVGYQARDQAIGGATAGANASFDF